MTYHNYEDRDAEDHLLIAAADIKSYRDKITARSASRHKVEIATDFWAVYTDRDRMSLGLEGEELAVVKQVVVAALDRRTAKDLNRIHDILSRVRFDDAPILPAPILPAPKPSRGKRAVDIPTEPTND